MNTNKLIERYLRGNKDFVEASLQQANLSETCLNGINLSRANLT
ncbi:MAG: pentapeptide repeat-containing protein, partial [Cyanobacteria bacterium P01_D01_bin.50]